MTTRPPSQAEQKSRIPTLDGWRALAILMVTVGHVAPRILNVPPEVLRFTEYGPMGVEIFFGLSGLLITKLLLEERDATGQISLQAFYTRRCFRVVLPYYIFVAVLWICSAIKPGLELTSCLLFFRNYIAEDFPGPYSTHLWSLAIEEHFYLLWPPLLILATPKYGRQVAIWTSIACGLWRIANLENFPHAAGEAFRHYRTDLRIDSLLWGCVLAFVLHEQKSFETLKKRLTPVVWISLLAAFLVCVVLYSPLTKLWIPMVVPLLIAGTLTHPNWAISRLFDWEPVRWIGRLSYSLYLWQNIFLIDQQHYWWRNFPLNLLLMAALTIFIYHFVEKPLVGIGRRLSDAAIARNRRTGATPRGAEGLATS